MTHNTVSPSDTQQRWRRAADELERRLRAGQPCRSEELLAAFPELASDPELAPDLVYQEFTLRRQLGHCPDPEEYCTRFPLWRDPLRRRFEADGWLGTDGSTMAEDTARVLGAPPPDDVKGLRFGRYEVIEEIGRGATGVVYKARDTEIGRLVAVKSLRGGRADSDATERFLREVQAEGRLNHPHLVRILDVGRQGGEPYFVLELAAGNLDKRLADYQADPRKAAELVEKLARALQHAHEQGVIHRDLKPSNILLDEHGEPKVSDFGLAKLLDDKELTVTGHVLGTPVYMSPEQADGRAADVMAASDVWALGVILYELLTGRRPFAGRSGSEVCEHIRILDPPRPRSLNADLSRDLETIALKCLEKDPARRYPSAAALADDLRNFLDGRLIQARPEGWLRRLRRGVRRHPAKITALLVLGGLLLAAAVVVHLSDPNRPVKTAQRRLAAGQAVTLIGETGPPRWSRWPMVEAAAAASGERDKPFSLRSMEPLLLELLPDPRVPRYRFRAEVRHDSSVGDDPAGVGIYFAYGSCVSPKGVEHCFWELTFNDMQGVGRLRDAAGQEIHQVALHGRRYRPAGADSVCDKRVTPGPQWKYFAPAVPPLGPAQTWRQLAVEVTPEKIRVFWEQQAIGELSRQDTDRIIRELLTLKPDPVALPAEGVPGVALGLYVRRSTASFRSVVIEPLE